MRLTLEMDDRVIVVNDAPVSEEDVEERLAYLLAEAARFSNMPRTESIAAAIVTRLSEDWPDTEAQSSELFWPGYRFRLGVFVETANALLFGWTQHDVQLENELAGGGNPNCDCDCPCGEEEEDEEDDDEDEEDQPDDGEEKEDAEAPARVVVAALRIHNGTPSAPPVP